MWEWEVRTGGAKPLLFGADLFSEVTGAQENKQIITKIASL